MTTQQAQRYEVIERLDSGGMAEVFRAKARSLQGFEKQVAIKRVLPNLARNEKFVKMFLDEARLSLHLSHANIVSVFDLGQSGDSYFIVMEYIEGANLKRFVDAAQRRDSTVPIPIAVFIGAKICEGLQYAHEKRDADRRPLSIVHRDISPPNVLLSNQGEVKLTDFGLAKATSQVELTDPGVVKGKFAYLSPEAAWGEAVDARTDIFATGIVMWEMLTGRRLFQSGSDLETLQKVRSAEVPSIRAFNPEVHEDLEAVVNRALARDRKDRYASARELGQALKGQLVKRGIMVTAYDLAAYMDGLFGGRPMEPSRSSDPQVASVHAAIEDQINRLTRLEASDLIPVTNDRSGLEDPRTWGEMGFDSGEADQPAPTPRPEASPTQETPRPEERRPTISGFYAAVSTPGAVTVSKASSVVARRGQTAITPGPSPAVVAPGAAPGAAGRPGTRVLPAAVAPLAPPPQLQQGSAPPGARAGAPDVAPVAAPRAPEASTPAGVGSNASGERSPGPAMVRAGARVGDPRFAAAAQRAALEAQSARRAEIEAEGSRPWLLPLLGLVVAALAAALWFLTR